MSGYPDLRTERHREDLKTALRNGQTATVDALLDIEQAKSCILESRDLVKALIQGAVRAIEHQDPILATRIAQTDVVTRAANRRLVMPLSHRLEERPRWDRSIDAFLEATPSDCETIRVNEGWQTLADGVVIGTMEAEVGEKTDSGFADDPVHGARRLLERVQQTGAYPWALCNTDEDLAHNFVQDAIISGETRVLQWLREEGYPLNDMPDGGSRVMYECLIGRGDGIPDTFNELLRHGIEPEAAEKTAQHDIPGGKKISLAELLRTATLPEVRETVQRYLEIRSSQQNGPTAEEGTVTPDIGLRPF